MLVFPTTNFHEWAPMNSKKFFQDNSRYINPKTDPVMHNINAGLLALSDEIEALQKNQKLLQRQFDALLRLIQTR